MKKIDFFEFTDASRKLAKQFQKVINDKTKNYEFSSFSYEDMLESLKEESEMRHKIKGSPYKKLLN